MYQALHQLGIDWKLLASQGANFLVLLVALTFLVYRPVIKVLNERRKKIEFGLQSAAEAEKRLRSIDELRQTAAREASDQAYAKVAAAENTAKQAAIKITSEAQEKALAILTQAGETTKQLEASEMARLIKNSSGLIRAAIAKATNQNPESIDEALIKEASQTLAQKLS